MESRKPAVAVPALPRESAKAVRPRRRAGPRVVPLASRRKRGTRSGAGPEDSGAAERVVSRRSPVAVHRCESPNVCPCPEFVFVPEEMAIPARFAKFYLVLKIGYRSTQVLYAGRDPAAAWKVRNVAEREREAEIKSTWFRMSQDGAEETLLP